MSVFLPGGAGRHCGRQCPHDVRSLWPCLFSYCCVNFASPQHVSHVVCIVASRCESRCEYPWRGETVCHRRRSCGAVHFGRKHCPRVRASRALLCSVPVFSGGAAICCQAKTERTLETSSLTGGRVRSALANSEVHNSTAPRVEILTMTPGAASDASASLFVALVQAMRAMREYYHCVWGGQ